LGLDRKVKLGPWARPLLRVLAWGKRLRATPFDPFGRARMRRVERELVEQYRDAIDAALERLNPGNVDDLVEIAGLPQSIRGYEKIKLANVERYRHALSARLAKLSVS
jgi:indolepyruvate ferredoxin oxidoreductase